MKYTIIIALLLIVLWVLYSLNVQYEWVELQLGWTKVAIAVAAAGGPLKYLKQKIDDKAQAKEELETEFRYRTLANNEFVERQMKNRRSASQQEKDTANSANNLDEFSINKPTMG